MGPTNQEQTTYDVVLYESHAYQKTHPDRLAVLGRLCGLKPAPPERCRVLELGGGEGGNLIPLALVYPESEFLGLDLATVPVERGKRVIADLGLTNIKLEARNILDVTREFGEFDYIIAHGVYAWVPDIVRDKLMNIAGANLAPQGIAIISYNAYPGARFREVIRDLLLFHTRGASTPAERIARSRELLAVMAEGRAGSDAYDQSLQLEAASTLERADSGLFHDVLADCWAPSSISAFAEHAGHHGLQYICDSSMIDTFNVPLTPASVGLIRSASNGDWVAQEQYADFFRARRFRQSLLTHARNTIDRDWPPRALDGLYAASQATEVSGPPPEFHFPFGGSIKADHAPTTAIMRRLISIWPKAEPVAASDAALMLDLFRRGIVDLRTSPGPAAPASDRPAVSPLARYQVSRGSPDLTTLLHQTIKLEGSMPAEFIALADGTRGSEEIARALNVSLETVNEQIQRISRAGLLIA